jgi:Tfp pilus assembly protein PilN
MKAVNLIPQDSRAGRGGLAAARGGMSVGFGPAYVLVAVLAAAVVIALLSVLEGNTVSDRKAKLAAITRQVATETAEAQRLSVYTSFEQQAEQRAETVRSLAAQRFDWHSSFISLSKVIGADAALQTLDGTIATTQIAGTESSAGGGGPSFALTGCTANQDDVARLMSRLRLINGVDNVALSTSTRTPTSGTGSSASGTATSTGSTPGKRARGCRNGWAVFNMTIDFGPATGSATSTGTSAGAPVSTTSSTTPSATTTPPGGSSTTTSTGSAG